MTQTRDKLFERKDDCCVNMVQRVATLEANSLNAAKTLEKVVNDLGAIVLSLAERRGVEKVVFAVGGCVFTIAGWGIEHLSHIKWLP